MSYELIIERTKALEMELSKLGASGRGLHEKLTSIETIIPLTIAKKIRFVASVRNKVMHSDVKPEGDTLISFARACDEVDRYLQELRTAKEKAEAYSKRESAERHAKANTNTNSEKGSLLATGITVVAAIAA